MGSDRLQLTDEPNIHSIGMTHLMKRIIEFDLTLVENETYISDGSIDPLLKEAVFSASQSGSDDLILQVNDAFVRVYRSNQDINMWIAGTSRESVDTAREHVKQSMPEFDKEEENVIPITFWAITNNGPMQINRRIEVPSWDQINENYAPPVREKLDQMMHSFQPSHGGQLVLWEGSPGTGKTYSLRALADAWRKWAKFHYITDPEEFFGNAAYMIQVLLQDNQYYMSEDEEDETLWKVLILEDCGELLAADAKERTGQAVARLLNVVDGLIGQGLKILVLVTTNEPVKKFHPAVMRPGRCAMHIEYKPFSKDEANAWLEAHDSKETVEKSSATIAELFGRLEGYALDNDVKLPAGFGG